MASKSAVNRSSPTKRSDNIRRKKVVQRQALVGGSKPNQAEMQKRLGNQGTQAWMAGQQVQTKLTVNRPGDKYEQEADRTAETVMRMPDPMKPGDDETKVQTKPLTNELQRTSAVPLTTNDEKPKVQRLCTECEKELGGKSEKKQLQKKEQNDEEAQVTPDIKANIDALNGNGKPLPDSSRNYFEPRFGADFSQVRVHTGTKAAETAKSLNAKAFTVGNNIVFGQGQFAPNSHEGQRLMGHELTHVVQQGSSVTGKHISRDLLDDAEALADAAKKKAQDVALQQLGDLGNKPVGASSGYTNPACPSTFCQPFIDKTQAQLDRVWAAPLLLAGIATKVNARVVPLWAAHIAGGSAPRNLSGDFGADFSNSPTTALTTQFLIGELRKDVETNHALLMGGAPSVTLDFTSRLAPALAKIDDPSSPDVMDFNAIGDTPGNLAGGIGKDETKFPIGAKPSPFDDARKAVILAALTRRADGSIEVAPSIQFTVDDTIDLCPGNCGATIEQAATIPLSRFEASGLSGDVPFTVQFPAPASKQAPFIVTPTIPKPAPVFPQTGKARTTTMLLRVRSGPGLKFPAIRILVASGTPVTVVTQAHADAIKGNDVWDQISGGGWISHAYVMFEAAP